MSVSMRRAGAVMLLLLLAACSSGPPWTLSRSRSAIRLRWYADATPAAAAEQIAQLHCAATGRSAVLATDEHDGSAEIADYRCR